ncbi:MAG TPA: hypothetical protein VNN55_08990 [bacterium]|nr:hypothetical protein [bacterium]
MPAPFPRGEEAHEAALRDEDFIRRQQVIRQAMLAHLYAARRVNRTVYVRDLTHALGHDPAEAEFALAYLAEAGLIDHKSVHVRITTAGIERFEQGD